MRIERKTGKGVPQLLIFMQVIYILQTFLISYFGLIYFYKNNDRILNVATIYILISYLTKILVFHIPHFPCRNKLQLNNMLRGIATIPEFGIRNEIENSLSHQKIKRENRKMLTI